jgi:Fic family protein
VAQSESYVRPSEFEPLLPTKDLGRLSGLAGEVTVRSLELANAAHPTTVDSLRSLLREMNSYYSNRIEGQSTHPLDIAAALRSEFSTSGDTARLQRLAVAHIHAEQALEGPDPSEVLTMKFLRRAHRELYGALPPSDRLTHEGTVVEPGQNRAMRVKVGRHVPPEPAAIDRFGRRFDEKYGRPFSLEEALVSVAAAHHRVSWIHPFEDGNGRAARLQTHCAMFPVTRGLWSVSRGLARNQDSYYRHLAAADRHREGDLDGRGNLSERGLSAWCEWFLHVCRDQVDFMWSMLNLDAVKPRIIGLIAARAAQDSRYRPETALALFHLFATGPLSRADFFRITGLGQRTAQSALAHLLQVGLVTSPDHRSSVRIAFPLDSLLHIFPELYPEAESSRPLVK